MTLAYPKGFEATLWSPEPPAETHRFVLGNDSCGVSGQPPLIAICMNPSVAGHTVSDRTINRLIGASQENGYGGWIMLNLYPERSTQPKNLGAYDSALSLQNCDEIEQVTAQYGVTEVLGAWGGNLRPTIRQAKKDVLERLNILNIKVFTWDALNKDGNPKHPLPRTGRLPMTGTKHYL